MSSTGARLLLPISVLLGYRDARFRLQSQAALYAQQCERHGVKVDAARYEEGLRQGRWDFPDRMT